MSGVCNDDDAVVVETEANSLDPLLRFKSFLLFDDVLLAVVVGMADEEDERLRVLSLFDDSLLLFDSMAESLNPGMRFTSVFDNLE